MVGVCALAVVMSACATTYDEQLVKDTAPATTTTLPSGAAADLLPKLRDEASRLSGVMIDEGDATAISEQIASLWAAAHDEVEASRPDLVDGFDQNVAMVKKAVQFKRAADADKASRNITALVKSYLA
ncbi:MAG: hypothetical protein JWN99_1066 [Ilumatobacteraceae bacterium]|nr:hypothetical protein [Ilumatobacteraceae bacterium]